MGDCVKLYIINYTDEYQALCALEMKRLFDAPFKDVIISSCDYDAGRSAFFKAKIDVLAHHHDLQTFLDLVSTVYVEKFKINYIKSKQDDMWRYLKNQTQQGAKVYVVCAKIDEENEMYFIPLSVC